MLKGICPDYSQDVMTVYINFTKSLLVHTTHSDTIFSWCSFNENPNINWPSWILDWTQPFSQYHLQRLKKRSASKDTLASRDALDCATNTNCKGIVVDTISSVGISPGKGISCRQSPTNLSEPVDKCHPNKYDSKPALSEALLRHLSTYPPPISQ